MAPDLLIVPAHVTAVVMAPSQKTPDPAADDVASGGGVGPSRGGPRPRVWAFGGGKGGVGKSVVAANVAVSMALQGRRVVLVDGDLGGANLDTLLGCERPTATLSAFFGREITRLEDLAGPTAIPNLTLVAGDGDALGAANPAHAQKQKLIRHLRMLPCDLVVVDLGAGTSFNTLDLYLAADVGVCVTTSESTSLQNCFSFIKTASLREQEQRDAAARKAGATVTPPTAAASGLTLRPTSLVVNRSLPSDARRITNLLHDLAGRFLGRGVRLTASLSDDPAVARSIRAGRPVCVGEPNSSFAHDIDTLARELWRPSPVAHEGPRTGINEEIDHDGVRLHVQTEDLGAPQCAVRTQVFRTDGSVVFTRRTAWEDAFFAKLAAAPADRVRFHHVAIVRALRAGRVEPLRRSA